MNDVDTALEQISDIRAQMAANTRFLGLSPEFNMFAAALALVVMMAQNAYPQWPAADGIAYIVLWGMVLLISSVVVAVDAVSRSRRFHGAMAQTMLHSALRMVLPFAAGGLVITGVVVAYAPASISLLPGIWMLMIGMLGFSWLSGVPAGLRWVAVWYFLCGSIVLWLGATSQSLSPVMMGVPFTVGQCAVAVCLYREQKGQESKLRASKSEPDIRSGESNKSGERHVR